MARKSNKAKLISGAPLRSADDLREGQINKYYARFRAESDVSLYIDSAYLNQFSNLDGDFFDDQTPAQIRIEVYDSLGNSKR